MEQPKAHRLPVHYQGLEPIEVQLFSGDEQYGELCLCGPVWDLTGGNFDPTIPQVDREIKDAEGGGTRLSVSCRWRCRRWGNLGSTFANAIWMPPRSR